MKRFKQIHGLVADLESDFEKFYDKENKAAGTRIRKGMQEIKVLAQQIRLEVQKVKNKEAAKKPAAKAAAPKKAAPKKK